SVGRFAPDAACGGEHRRVLEQLLRLGDVGDERRRVGGGEATDEVGDVCVAVSVVSVPPDALWRIAPRLEELAQGRGTACREGVQRCPRLHRARDVEDVDHGDPRPPPRHYPRGRTCGVGIQACVVAPSHSTLVMAPATSTTRAGYHCPSQKAMTAPSGAGLLL